VVKDKVYTHGIHTHSSRERRERNR